MQSRLGIDLAPLRARLALAFALAALGASALASAARLAAEGSDWRAIKAGVGFAGAAVVAATLGLRAAQQPEAPDVPPVPR